MMHIISLLNIVLKVMTLGKKPLSFKSTSHEQLLVRHHFLVQDLKVLTSLNHFSYHNHTYSFVHFFISHFSYPFFGVQDILRMCLTSTVTRHAANSPNNSPWAVPGGDKKNLIFVDDCDMEDRPEPPPVNVFSSFNTVYETKSKFNAEGHRKVLKNMRGTKKSKLFLFIPS